MKEINKLSKIDLHCHLDGSLSRDFVEAMQGRSVDRKELQVDPDCRSLAEYLEKFELPLQCLQTKEGLEKAGYDFIKEVAKENVRYVEVRFAPNLSKEEGLEVEEILEAVLRGLEKGKQEYGVSYQVIVCAMRHHTEEENWSMIKAASAYLGKGVCAADLAGNEAAFPMEEFMGLFQKVKEIGMPFTIHAGECGRAENIRQSIEAGAVRIGHGIAMKGCKDLLKLCQEKQIGIEMCPISNLQTKAVKSEEDYPLREFLDAGLLVTINTDNRTVSGTTITKELEFVREHYGVSEREWIQMMRNALKVSFADKETKELLMKGWSEYERELE